MFHVVVFSLKIKNNVGMLNIIANFKDSFLDLNVNIQGDLKGIPHLFCFYECFPNFVRNTKHQ